MIKKTIILFSMILILAPPALTADAVPPKADFVLNLDYSRFRYNDESCYLEIYYSFHPQQLTYEFDDGEYYGGVILSTKITSMATDEIVVNRRSRLELSEADTSGAWYRFPFITQAGLALPHGSYTLQVTAADSLAPARSDSLLLDLALKEYSAEVAVSDLELCKSIRSSKNKTDPFYKNSLEVVPYPALVFGASSIPTAFYYVELYNLTPGVNYTVQTEILNTQGQSVYDKSKTKAYKAKNFLEVGATPMTAYPSGKYTFRFALAQNETELTSTSKVFYLLNQHVDEASRRPAIPASEDFVSLSRDELSREFKLVRYLATQEEILTYDGLSSDDAKRTFLAQLWAKIGRGRRELPPIDRTGYLARAETANDRFAAFSKEGWETDRGRVFMIYAEPNEIERAPSQSDTKPYEVWRYFNIENGVEFVFVDRLGFGNLELVHSTKRNEFQDEAWERFLR